MNRYFLESLNFIEETIISGEQFNHMTKVLRERAKNRVIISIDDDFDYICEIISIEKSCAKLKFLEKQFNSANPKLDLTVYFGLLKGDRNDIVVQKLSELGVKKIIPFVSQNSTVTQESNKIERLRKIALESAKQCGRSRFLKIGDVIKFDEIFLENYDLKLIANENEKNRIESQINDYLSIIDVKMALIVGSEGGFESFEIEKAVAKGYKSVTLGKRILRAETASIVFATIINYLWGEFN